MGVDLKNIFFYCCGLELLERGVEPINTVINADEFLNFRREAPPISKTINHPYAAWLYADYKAHGQWQEMPKLGRYYILLAADRLSYSYFFILSSFYFSYTYGTYFHLNYSFNANVLCVRLCFICIYGDGYLYKLQKSKDSDREGWQRVEEDGWEESGGD